MDSKIIIFVLVSILILGLLTFIYYKTINEEIDKRNFVNLMFILIVCGVSLLFVFLIIFSKFISKRDIVIPSSVKRKSLIFSKSNPKILEKQNLKLLNLQCPSENCLTKENRKILIPRLEIIDKSPPYIKVVGEISGINNMCLYNAISKELNCDKSPLELYNIAKSEYTKEYKITDKEFDNKYKNKPGEDIFNKYFANYLNRNIVVVSYINNDIVYTTIYTPSGILDPIKKIDDVYENKSEKQRIINLLTINISAKSAIKLFFKNNHFSTFEPID